MTSFAGILDLPLLKVEWLEARVAGKQAVFDLLRRLTAIGVLPDDSDEQRLRKVVVTSGSILITTVAPIWSITYGAMGLWTAAAIPFAY